MNAQEAKKVLRDALAHVVRQLDADVDVVRMCLWLSKFAKRMAKRHRELEIEVLKEQLVQQILAARRQREE